MYRALLLLLLVISSKLIVNSYSISSILIQKALLCIKKKRFFTIKISGFSFFQMPYEEFIWSLNYSFKSSANQYNQKMSFVGLVGLKMAGDNNLDKTIWIRLIYFNLKFSSAILYEYLIDFFTGFQMKITTLIPSYKLTKPEIRMTNQGRGEGTFIFIIHSDLAYSLFSSLNWLNRSHVLYSFSSW